MKGVIESVARIDIRNLERTCSPMFMLGRGNGVSEGETKLTPRPDDLASRPYCQLAIG